jgi:hypothetical protein
MSGIGKISECPYLAGSAILSNCYRIAMGARKPTFPWILRRSGSHDKPSRFAYNGITSASALIRWPCASLSIHCPRGTFTSLGSITGVNEDDIPRYAANRKAGCIGPKNGIYFIYTEWGAMMPVPSDNLLVKFRSRDTQFGVTRRTVKALAKELDVNETQVIHMALSKFATDVLPAYELDDGPLTTKQVAALRKDVEKHFPKGKLISRESLFKWQRTGNFLHRAI